MLEYKADWYGRDLVVIDRWFPSSKRCGACGAVCQALALNVREWMCGCGARHDSAMKQETQRATAGIPRL
jgi:putative transposase